MAGTAAAIVYFDRALTGAEYSLDGGTTWFDTADAPQTLAVTGGTIQIALNAEHENRADITITGPTTPGDQAYLVRGINGDGPGATVELAVMVFEAQGAIVGLAGLLPHGDILQPGSVTGAGDGTGFLVAYSYRGSVSSSGDLDFGNGVTFALGSRSASAQPFVIVVRYSGAGVAQEAVALRASAGQVDPLSVQLVTAPEGDRFGLGAAISGTATWYYRKHGGASEVTIGSHTATSSGVLWALDADLVPEWGVAGRLGGGGEIRITAAGDFIFANCRRDAQRIGVAGAMAPSLAGMPGIAVSVAHRINSAGTWQGFWATRLGATWNSPTIIQNNAGGDSWWLRGNSASSGSDDLVWWNASGSTVLHTSSKGSNTRRLFNMTGTAYNTKFEVGSSLDVQAPFWIDGALYWLATLSVTGTARAWAGTTVTGTLASGTELVWISTSASGDAVLATSALGVTGLTAYSLPPAFVAGSVGHWSAPVSTSADATALGFTHQGGEDAVVLRFDGSGILPVAVAARLGTSTAERPVAIGAQWGEDYAAVGGGWAIVRASGSTTAVTFDPPGDTVAPGSTDDRWMVASLDTDGNWNTSSGGAGVPPDPLVAVPPTDPVGTWPATVAEGGTLTATLSTTDPNAGYASHPEPFTSLTIAIYDSTTQAWRTSGTVAAAGGTLTVTNDGVGGVSVDLTPDPDFDGEVLFSARAVATTASRTLYSNTVDITTDWIGEADQPGPVEGAFPATILEDGTADAEVSVEDPDTEDAWTWRLSPVDEAPYTPDSSGMVTVYDQGDGVTVAGTVTVHAGQGTTSATLRYEAAANWHGSTGVSVRVAENSGLGEWAWLPMTVEAVVDIPTAPSPATMPTIAEDSFASETFTTTDPDFLTDPGSTYTWQVSVDGTTWDEEGVDTGTVLVQVDASEEDPGGRDDLVVGITTTPDGNWYGSYSFYLRVKKDHGGGTVYSPATLVGGTVTPVDDAPSRPTPTRMPTVAPGGVSVQRFTATDVDNEELTFEVTAAPSGSWSETSAALAAGTATVDQGLADGACEVRYTPDPGTSGPYRFYLRAKSGTTAGAWAEVTGWVSDEGVAVELMRVTRSAGSVTLASLGPLSPTAVRITEAVTGPGSAEVRVPVAQLIARAEAQGEAVDELVAPGTCELHVYANEVLAFAGPLVSYEEEMDGLSWRLSCRGLLSYLERRAVETTVTFTADEQTEIMADLVDATQALPYGALDIDTAGVTNTGVTIPSIEFEVGTTVSAALEELRRGLDGAEYRITPDREFLADTWVGTDRRAGCLITTGQAQRLTIVDEWETITTVARVVGDAVTGAAQADSTTLARYGRVSGQRTARAVTDAGVAEDLAEELVAARSLAGRVIRLTALTDARTPVGRRWYDYVAGDLISVEVETRRGVVRIEARIINRTVTAGAPGGIVEDDLELEVLGPEDTPQAPRGRHNPDVWDQLSDLYRRLP
jgi:hypothetical protein